MRRLAICMSLVSCSLVPSAHATGFYTKAGILGAGLGYFNGMTDHWSSRMDVTTVSKYKHDFKHDFTLGSVNYKASLNADQAGVYADWFPFGNGFRVSGGALVRKLQAQVLGHPHADGRISINGTAVDFGPNDMFLGEVKFPAIAPYLGVGWGYHSTQKPGLGFVLDLGVAFGRPNVNLTASESLRNKLDWAKDAGVSIADELENQRRKLKDTASKVKIFPQAYMGISYHF